MPADARWLRMSGLVARKRFLMGALATSVMIAVAGAWIARGNALHAMLGVLFPLYIATPLAALGLVAWLFERRERRRSKRAEFEAWTAVACTGLVLVAMGSCTSYGIGLALGRLDISNAMRFSDRMVPRLERFAAEHGNFPREITSVLEPGERLPRLAADDKWSYHAHGSWFEFSITYPTAIMRGRYYDSRTRSWNEWS